MCASAGEHSRLLLVELIERYFIKDKAECTLWWPLAWRERHEFVASSDGGHFLIEVFCNDLLGVACDFIHNVLVPVRLTAGGTRENGVVVELGRSRQIRLTRSTQNSLSGRHLGFLLIRDQVQP